MHTSRGPYGTLPGLPQSVSRLIIGGDGYRSPDQMTEIFDAYFERGGSAIDTAWIYGHGSMETWIGDYLTARSVRPRVTLITKGGLTPTCTPDGLRRQLSHSLQRLGVDSVDVYLMHRDNLDVPVDEFVDVLNDMLSAGKIKSFGGSNWTRERFDAANAYARSRQLEVFSVLSNQHSLARMVNPPWGGCLSCAGEAWGAWLMERQVVNLAWSAQARGFFTERSAPELKQDPLLYEAYYSDDNFERKRRAEELARRRGCSATEVALGFVLSQPHPSFAVVGPRSVAELDSCFRALHVSLTKADLDWLNLKVPESPV